MESLEAQGSQIYPLSLIMRNETNECGKELFNDYKPFSPQKNFITCMKSQCHINLNSIIFNFLANFEMNIKEYC